MMKAWKSIFVLCSFLLMLSGCFHQEEKKAEPKKKESIPETKEYTLSGKVVLYINEA